MSNAIDNSTNPKRYGRSHEPIAWSLFGAGGMVVAFIIPVLALISGLLMPSWPADSLYQNLLGLTQSWLGKLALLAVISLTLYHCAHRIYHGLHDLHVEANQTLMLVLFYGGATLCSAVCAGVLLII
ncbi:MAG: fumarate reductase subunit FrdD [Halopseudomonas sp.]